MRRLLVVNRATPGTVLARQAPEAIATHGELAGVIRQRIAFAEAAAVGESVLTYGPRGVAAQEVERLFDLVMNGGAP